MSLHLTTGRRGRQLYRRCLLVARKAPTPMLQRKLRQNARDAFQVFQYTFHNYDSLMEQAKEPFLKETPEEVIQQGWFFW